MRFIILFLFLVIISLRAGAQLVSVEYNYNNIGDCIFGAQNQSKTPLFLNLFFTNLENSVLREPLPYIKMLDPGYNALFTLQRDGDMAPHFIFDTKVYRSKPDADVNLDFPYLIPFAPGTIVKPVDVKSIVGFWGDTEPKSWKATGFNATPGVPVYSARQGQIVEIVDSKRSGDPKLWYNTWINSITLLQSDGTLITYKNVINKEKKLALNQKIQAGQLLGEVAPNASEIVLVIYHNTLKSSDFVFIIPLFATAPGKTEIVNSAQTIEVVHPDEVIGIEMTKKEFKKYLSESRGKK